MAKNKGARIMIVLECVECRANIKDRAYKGISRYSSQKNRRNNPERLELKKYCPNCNRSTIHKETK
uniref:Large ribosomal subunit protein bL33c n=1 Tax=Toxarium undulatum TaxID=210620 RepID=A0A1D8D9H7_9STRA|nr:ribosomal protein L33 [Toxarium undulatum]AOS86600.1 ribosomal protein L33 [Toxarium undulatum]